MAQPKKVAPSFLLITSFNCYISIVVSYRVVFVAIQQPCYGIAYYHFYDPATQFADYGLITILMNFKVITKKVIHTKHKELKTSTITG